MSKEANLEKIILKYDDGTEKEIDKGLVINNKCLDNGDCKLEMEFVNMKGTELRNVIYGVLEFGYKSGILEDLLEEVDDE